MRGKLYKSQNGEPNVQYTRIRRNSRVCRQYFRLLRNTARLARVQTADRSRRAQSDLQVARVNRSIQTRSKQAQNRRARYTKANRHDNSVVQVGTVRQFGHAQKIHVPQGVYNIVCDLY